MPLAVSTADAVRDQVIEIVAECLGVNPAEIDPHTPLALYGLDSLRAVELVMVLEDALERQLPEGLLVDHPHIDALVHALEHGVQHPPPAQSDDRHADANALIWADCVLPSDIRPGVTPAPPSTRPRILLTGATGFLGAHLLQTLLAETDAEVYCLVRDSGCDHSPGARIRRGLERYGLWDDAAWPRIHAVAGDLSRSRLGLATDRYAMLAATVDTIYDAAADVNWVAPYAALRATNVEATRELLRLACHDRPTPFHFISSLSVCYVVGRPGVVTEDDDLLPSVEQLPLGYAQSKCVAEALVRQAAARGLRTSIHRPALLSGDSTTGASKLDDFLAALFKGCVQMGMAPDLDWRVDAVPVDQVARAIVYLSGRDRPGAGSFHLSGRRPHHWRECVLWMNLFGYPVTLVSYDRWLQQLAEDARSADHALHRLRGFFLKRWSGGATVPELYQVDRSSAPESGQTRAIVSEAGLDCQRLDAASLERCFDDYVAAGFLPPPQRAGWSAGDRRRGASAHDHAAIFQPMLRRHFADDSLRVTGVRLCARGSEHSVIGELSSWRHRGRTGLFHYRLTFARHGTEHTLDVVTKVKPEDREVVDVAEAVAATGGAQLAQALGAHRDRIGLRGTHVRELALYEEGDERLRRHMPVCFGTWRDEPHQEWGLVLERLDGEVLIDATDDPAAWTPAHVDAALTGLADIHAVWFGREDDLRRRSWIGHIATCESVVEMTPLWRALADQAAAFLTAWAGPSLVRTHRGLVESIGEWWRPLDVSPRTLIHNDFSPRNVAIRGTGASLRLCAYDWELATLGAPQCDLAHFLCFVLDSDVSDIEAARYVEHHRVALEAATGVPIDPAQWRVGFRSSLADLLVNRLMFYVMINRVRPLRFLPRIVRTWQRLNDLFHAGPSR